MNKEDLINWAISPEITKYYSKIRSYPSTKCIECDWYLDCGGGCPLRWAVYEPQKIIKGRR